MLKVKCIDASNQKGKDRLQEGQVYQAFDDGADYYWVLIGLVEVLYMKDRFVEVNSQEAL